MKPKLRPIEGHTIQHQGQPWVLLQDPLRLSDIQIAVPQPLGPLLGLMDGTRNEAGLEAGLQLRAGVRLAPGVLDKLLTDLNEAYLLDNERFGQARDEAIRAFREAPFRPQVTYDVSGPFADPEQAGHWLQGFVNGLAEEQRAVEPKPVRGIISPHIDYQRGGPVYAQVWQKAARSVLEADLVIILGTDHRGSEGALTLTPQSYATPWGVLPTDGQVVGALADALGPEAVFAEELHHRLEHSIELAAGWLHFVRKGTSVPLVPILCGSFGGFVAGEGEPSSHQQFDAALEVLAPVMASRRTLVVAAADLAHVGPAFGDRFGLDGIAQAQLRKADEQMLEAVYAGDAEAFFQQLKQEGDRRNVCGLPPIYLMLRLLGEAAGEPAGYDLCPADPQGLSFVTIAGSILF